MTPFGKTLRSYRLRCNDPLDPGRRLSQERLGELLGGELGSRGFSGAAVSDWERDKSKIHADDRLLLTSLLIVLRREGGIRTVSEANELLEAGNYRTLNPAEQERVFPGDPVSPPHPADGPEFPAPSLKKIFFAVDGSLRERLAEAREGPEPAWPRLAVVWFRSFSDRWSVLHTLRALLWLLLWLLVWGLVSPSLRWPFSGREDAIQAVTLYAAGALVIPVFIGVLTDTKNNAYWRQHNLAIAPATRLYTHQGAFIGFHAGYFAVFVFGLLKYFAHWQPSTSFDQLLMSLPLVVGYIGARLVPYNLWQAYGRLELRDGLVFFFFIAFGPLWSLFFLEFYPYLLAPVSGAFIFLAAVFILILLMAWQYHRKATTVIPLSWWLVFWGLVLACQIAAVLLGR